MKIGEMSVEALQREAKLETKSVSGWVWHELVLRELARRDQLPDELSFDEEEALGGVEFVDDGREKSALECAREYVQTNGGQIYTQVDCGGGASQRDSCKYVKGEQVVNGTGVYAVVKVSTRVGGM